MKNKKMNKGITLVALVVTIVILIILATISINAVLGENGLIKRAEKAAEYQANAEKSENDAIDQLLHQAGVATGEIIENPYDKDAWKYAWVCTNGTWGDKLETGAEIPEGEGIVVAKFYETGKKITPPDLNFNGTTYTFTEGNEYVMVIEGQGEMGQLMETSGNNITAAYGWHTETAMFMMNPTGTTCTIPYISEAIICDGVKNIGGYAFIGDTGLNKVTISKNITSIGDNAFCYCGSLTNVRIPDGVTSIGTNVFYGCTNLTDLIIADGVVISIERTTFEGCINLTNLTIGDGVTNIGEGAFAYCESLKKVMVGNNVKSIGKGAFGLCTSLTTVKIGNSVKSIGDSAFFTCSSLTEIKIPDSVTSIGNVAFYGCRSLTSVTIGNSVTSIGENAFKSCSGLTNITIPDSVISIGNAAFDDCSNLKNITIDSETIASSITDSDSSGNLVTNATTIYINEEIEETSIGSYITTNYDKQATSDKEGYVKYTKKVS